MNRYVIVDGGGIMLNRIATDAENLIYAGYGSYIAYEGGGTIPAITVEEPWVYLAVTPDAQMAQGDILDINTGHVTHPPQPEVIVE